MPGTKAININSEFIFLTSRRYNYVYFKRMLFYKLVFFTDVNGRDNCGRSRSRYPHPHIPASSSSASDPWTAASGSPLLPQRVLRTSASTTSGSSCISVPPPSREIQSEDSLSCFWLINVSSQNNVFFSGYDIYLSINFNRIEGAWHCYTLPNLCYCYKHAILHTSCI